MFHCTVAPAIDGFPTQCVSREVYIVTIPTLEVIFMIFDSRSAYITILYLCLLFSHCVNIQKNILYKKNHYNNNIIQ